MLRRSWIVVALAFSSMPLALGTATVPRLADDACPEPVAPAAAPVDDFQTAVERYSSWPGFVDLVADPNDPTSLVALFDLERAEGLPEDSRIGELNIRVVGDTFVPLVAPPSADPPVLPVVCANRISPGVGISTPVGGCSLNFIFRDAAGKTYAGTAGHCFSALGQRMTVNGIGQVGTLRYFINAGLGNDFALVEIDANRVALVNPAMCHWGGPTGSADGAAAGIVRHYGFGIGYGTTILTRPRSGYAPNPAGPNSFTFLGTVASGDSGSGARLDNGLGLGIITHVNGGAIVFAHSAPFGYGTRVARAISLAEAGTGLDLSLVTAPVA